MTEKNDNKCDHEVAVWWDGDAYTKPILKSQINNERIMMDFAHWTSKCRKCGVNLVEGREA